MPSSQQAEIKQATDATSGAIVEQSGTTTFVDDANVIKTSTRTNLSVQDLGPPKVDENSISDFLAKPILIHSGVVNNTNTQNTNLHSFDIEFHLSNAQIFLRKLQGYNLMKATAVIRVVINAQPFQQGRLLMHFLPLYNEQVNTNIYNGLHNVNLTMKTQHPNVEVDFRDATAEMEIPYIAPSSHYDLTTGRFCWGRVFLDVLSRPRVGSTGDSNVSYTLWMSFKDLELSAPTFEAHAPIGTGNAPNKRTKVKTGRIKVSKALDLEERSKPWASTLLSTASSVAGALSVIPGAGEITALASGAFSVASDVLSYFGWSKPFSTLEMRNVTWHPLRYLGNASGTFAGDNLTMDPVSKMEPLSGFAGSSVDEMAFSFLKQIPAYVESFDLESSDTQNTVIYSKSINPVNFYTENVYTSAVNRQITTRSYPPFGYLAKNFLYWRGSIEVTFKFVKTDYHSARLLVTYTPDSNSTGPTNAQSAYSLREIIDIRSCSEHTISLPYYRNLNYLSVEGNADVAQSGWLEVRVLNSLRAPDTVADTFETLVYYSGGEDFELACPLIKRVPFRAEAAVPSTLMDTSLHHNVASIGDPFLSIKQLMSCAVPTTFYYDSDSSSFSIRPFLAMIGQAQTSTGTLLETPLTSDWFQILVHGYVFMRGGVRLSMTLIPDSENLVDYRPVALKLDSNLAGNDNDAIFSSNSDWVTEFVTVNKGIHAVRNKNATYDVVVPHMAKTPYKLIRAYTLTQAGKRPSGSRPDMSEVRVEYNFPPSSVQYLYRTAADDMAFGYFIGFPALLQDATST